VPHCRWEIVIEDETETLPEKDITKITRGTTAATFTFPPMKDGTPHIPTDGAGGGGTGTGTGTGAA
jgi:hypothetical protein